jgi:hypothetical protein
MKMRFLFAVAVILWSRVAAADQPTTEQIEAWFIHSGIIAHILDCKGVSTTKLSEYFQNNYKKFREIDPKRPVYSFNSNEAIEVKLKDFETGYLLEAAGPGGRNDFLRVLLLRPQREEVCEIENPRIKSVLSVLDLDNNGISEIVAEGVDSGQGSEHGARYIMQLDGCTPVVLRSVVFEDNEGAYGRESNRYYRKDVKWSFVDIDGDGTLDLKETRIVHEGRNGRPPIVTKGLYRYLYKENAFVRYVDYLREHQRRN